MAQRLPWGRGPLFSGAEGHDVASADHAAALRQSPLRTPHTARALSVALGHAGPVLGCTAGGCAPSGSFTAAHTRRGDGSTHSPAAGGGRDPPRSRAGSTRPVRGAPFRGDPAPHDSLYPLWRSSDLCEVPGASAWGPPVLLREARPGRTPPAAARGRPSAACGEPWIRGSHAAVTTRRRPRANRCEGWAGSDGGAGGVQGTDVRTRLRGWNRGWRCSRGPAGAGARRSDPRLGSGNSAPLSAQGDAARRGAREVRLEEAGAQPGGSRGPLAVLESE